MKPRIEILPEKKLIGQRLTMSLFNNKTGELWKNFMPRRKEIENYMSTELYSINVYDQMYFKNFNPINEFEKWATIEVKNLEAVPNNMETITLIGGLYAVFHYKGLNTDHKIFEYIYGNWLPSSEYQLDNRPHFEILGEKYKNDDPTSEEEIWIPIMAKQ